MGSAGILPAVAGILPETELGAPLRERVLSHRDVPGKMPGTAGRMPALPFAACFSHAFSSARVSGADLTLRHEELDFGSRP